MVNQVIPDPDQVIVVDGDEAEHAVRVKRLAPGELVGLVDGAGVVATAAIEQTDRALRGGGGRGHGLALRIRDRAVTPFPGVRPCVEVFTATPKGGRVDEMIDQLSQVGAASWAPLDTARGIVDPREAKLARLERIAREAAKQCGRAWVLRMGPLVPLAKALAWNDGQLILADASGVSWRPAESPDRPVRLVVGPEGGWTPEELASARAAGAKVVRFGPLTMRIETAAVAACAIVMAG